jgi:isoquinoline 1-oxidoreductase beta subunit
MENLQSHSRRSFLKVTALTGGGLLLGFYLPPRTVRGADMVASDQAFAPNAFIRIGADDKIGFIVNKSEMGQGVYTSLSMLIAEELEVDWEAIRVESAPVDSVYNHTQFGMQITGGSTSVSSSWEQLRKAGATARVMLVEAAADLWGVDTESCRAANGYVLHQAGERKASYGELARYAAEVIPPDEVKLKAPEDFKIIGTSTKRLDSPEKVNATAQFGMDVKVPGMLTAVIARPPVFGAKLKSVDPDKAKAIPGVKHVVPIKAGVAVVAVGYWAAKRGRDMLQIDWDEGENATLSSAALRQRYAELVQKPGLSVRKEGDAEGALAHASQTIEAVYEVPYLAHAPMEPLNCLVDLRDDRCEIWTGTQFQTGDRQAAAKIAGLEPAQVQIHTLYLGGGFGRRANPASDFVVEAVEVAKVVKEPVKVVWSREDDIRGGYYRPMFYNKLFAALGKANNPVAWSHRIVGQSIVEGTPFSGMIKEGVDITSVEGAATLPYNIPNVSVDYHPVSVGVPVLWWRSVGNSVHGFVTEGFIDELAHASGRDPFEFRRQLLAEHPRHKTVLEWAAEKAGWDKSLPAGIGRGIAVHESFGSVAAQVAEVSVDKGGNVEVHRVVCAIDCGLAVNPDGVKAQMESAIVFGLSAALYGEITFKDGRVQQSNFHDYRVLRMNQMPRIEVHIVPSSETIPTGVGEPGVPPIAPAVANAVFSATGKRVRRLPIEPTALRRAYTGTARDSQNLA